MRIVPLLGFALVLALPVHAFPWPVAPTGTVQPLGNNWGNYQDYGGAPYFHPGIDIITPGRINAPVVAVTHGWVKGWGTISAEFHYRLAISDSGPGFTGRAPGWLYAHIDTELPHKNLGDEVFAGDTIGYLVWWPVDGFDHLHYARISDTGATWMRFPDYTWWFIENPLLTVQPYDDTESPVFENARGSDRFAFCRDNVNNSYLPATGLTGAVDIIARVYDKTGYTTTNPEWDKLAPFKLEHMIRRHDGLVVRPWTLSLSFAGRLDDDAINVVYKSDRTCRSRGDYEDREYYYIVTNSDGDSIIEASDAAGNWNTAGVGDGDYWVIVRAWDIGGNSTTDSMLVRTDNGVAVEDLPSLALSAPLRAWPNPGPGPATIGFAIGKPAHARLRVFDAAGRVAGILADSRLEPGEHVFRNLGLRPGVYVVKLSLDGELDYSTKLVVTR